MFVTQAIRRNEEEQKGKIMFIDTNKYEFKVLLKNGKNRQTFEYQKDNQTYIEGRDGSEYEIYFRNFTNRRVEIVLSVDGLSVNDGKTAGIETRGYVVKPFEEVTIPGWRINDQTAAAFKFGKVGRKNTYVEQLSDDGYAVDVTNQGVIGIMVFREYDYYYRTYGNGISYGTIAYPLRASGLVYDSSSYINPTWQNGQLSNGFEPLRSHGICSSEPVASASLNSNVGDSMSIMAMNMCEPQPQMGTEFGRDVDFKVGSTTFLRENETVPNFVTTIMYDSLNNLKAKGIVVDNVAKSAISKAFPNYPNNGCPIPKGRG